MATVSPQNAGSNWLQPHIVEDIPVELQVARHMPVRYIDGRTLNFAYLRDAVPNGATLSSCADYSVQDYTIDLKTFGFAELQQAIQTCATEQDTIAYPNDINEALARKVERALHQKFWELIDTGVAGSGSFAGLQAILPAGQKVTVGGVPTLQQFDDAYSLVKDNEGRPTAIMSNRGAWKRYLALMRAAGLMPEFIDTEWADPIRGVVKGKVLSVYGTPWYINNAMPNAGAGGTTNVYFMVLGDNGESRPGHGVTMIMPSARRNNPYIIRNLPAAAGAEPTVLTSAVTKIMVWPVGYALGSASAVSMLQNITPL